MRHKSRPWLALAMIFGAVTASAEWHIESGPGQTVMIELFTSQGCNSCPPAEEFLNRFKDNPGLWHSFIPLAFHVDYWDYLGWKDRFALPDNAARQRRYARLGHARGVYTPGFVVNGRGWRPGWFSKDLVSEVRDAGILHVSLAAERLAVEYDAEGMQKDGLELHVALLGMGLGTDIGAGENAGRQSRHEFVVLSHVKAVGSGPKWLLPLPEAEADRANGLALVAWVSRQGDPTPLQAVGGFLPGQQPGGSN